MPTSSPKKFSLAKNEASSGTVESPSTRWWESYLVRYFIGFVFGTICIAIVAFKADLITSENLATNSALQSTASIVAMCLLGIGYCYIASTPITVIHSGRYGSGIVDSLSRFMWLAVSILCVLSATTNSSIFELKINDCVKYSVLIVAAICTLFSVIDSFRNNYPKFKEWLSVNVKFIERPQKKPHSSLYLFSISLAWSTVIWFVLSEIFEIQGVQSHSVRTYFLLSIPIIWIGFTQYCILFRILKEKDDFLNFYVSLFKARRIKNAKDVRDTYTHLREHSNSIFILGVEVGILALLLIVLHFNRLNNAGHVNIEDYFSSVLSAMVFWMIPTIFMWARANDIERDFSNNPRKYLQ